jgi:hypothetical protein
MGTMTGRPDDPPAGSRPPEPGDRRPRHLLDRAPGERIAARAAADVAKGAAVPAGPGAPGVPRDRAARRVSLVRAAAFGLVAGAGGLAAYVIASLVLLWVGLLLVVAVTAGYLVGVFACYGAGADRAAIGSGRLRAIAVVLACAVVIAGLAIAWAASGRYLDPVEFARQVYGLTVPLQLAGAAAGALAGTR